jgi:methylmalonyl-CoA mutase
MLTRYDAWTNILRVTTAAFGAAIGGANAITTAPFTDALGRAR